MLFPRRPLARVRRTWLVRIRAGSAMGLART